MIDNKISINNVNKTYLFPNPSKKQNKYYPSKFCDKLEGCERNLLGHTLPGFIGDYILSPVIGGSFRGSEKFEKTNLEQADIKSKTLEEKTDGNTFRKELLLKVKNNLNNYKQQNINEISHEQKRELIRNLINLNTDVFNFSEELKKQFPFIPKNKEEYCSTLSKLAKSIGIETKPITKEIRDGFYQALNSIEQPNSRFRTFDFENPNLKIELSYPGETFIQDVKNLVDNLTQEEKDIVCGYYGFEFKTLNENKSVINGYPVNITDNNKLSEINNPELKTVIQQMQPFIERFSEHNNVKIEGEEELSAELNKIIKAFPEFLTEIGKKQHGTHHYTLAVHSLKVLQGVINNPNYDKLPENDKNALKISALFHDITKREGMRDETHPSESALDTYYLIKKLNLPEDEKLKIYQIIKTHNWLQLYNKKFENGKLIDRTPQERQEISKDIAFELRKGNSFEMACILTEADMKAVQRGGKFFDGLEPILKQGIEQVGGFVTQLKKTAVFFS